MPVYEYACKACEHEFELEQRITEKPVKKCPKCGAMKAKRLISRTSFVLKGSGWYSDLYAKPPAKGEGKKDEGKKESAGEKGSGSDASPSGGGESASGSGSGKESKTEGSAKSDKGSGSSQSSKGSKGPPPRPESVC